MTCVWWVSEHFRMNEDIDHNWTQSPHAATSCACKKHYCGVFESHTDYMSTLHLHVCSSCEPSISQIWLIQDYRLHRCTSFLHGQIQCDWLDKNIYNRLVTQWASKDFVIWIVILMLNFSMCKKFDFKQCVKWTVFALKQKFFMHSDFMTLPLFSVVSFVTFVCHTFMLSFSVTP